MTGYGRNLFTKGLVLGVLEYGPLTGSIFRDRVKDACREADKAHADFDFVRWAGCLLWDLMDTMATHGFVETKATRTATVADWIRTTIRLSEKGRDFLATLRQELAEHGVPT